MVYAHRYRDVTRGAVIMWFGVLQEVLLSRSVKRLWSSSAQDGLLSLSFSRLWYVIQYMYVKPYVISTSCSTSLTGEVVFFIKKYENFVIGLKCMFR